MLSTRDESSAEVRSMYGALPANATNHARYLRRLVAAALDFHW